MRRFVFAMVLGIVIGCEDASHCDEIVDCDQCRSCATEIGHGCHTAYLACTLDPACDDLWSCVDGCWNGMDNRDAVLCERECRGTIGGTAVDLYDEYIGCVDDACTLSCDW